MEGGEPRQMWRGGRREPVEYPLHARFVMVLGSFPLLEVVNNAPRARPWRFVLCFPRHLPGVTDK